LEQLSAGSFGREVEVAVGDGPLGQVEQAINFLMMDLQTLQMANREKEASLEAQKHALDERLNTIEEQRALLASQQEELAGKLRVIERQAAAIRELSTPVMEIWDDILMLPIVGVVDTRRSMDIMNNLLQSIVARQAKFVIVDVTGVEVVDTKTADYLLKVVRAANLLGARCVLTGLSPAVAQTLVTIGADLTEVKTLRNPKEGLRHCLKALRQATTMSET
jgi:rsbT co-antagonist protein RsbR